MPDGYETFMALSTTQIITTLDVQKQLLGLSALLARVDQPTLTGFISDCINDAQAEFENDTRFWVWPRICKTFPSSTDVFDPTGTSPTGTYNWKLDQFDFYKSGFRSMGYFQLIARPAVSIQQISVQYGVGNTLLVYPQQWIRLNAEMGTVAIVPYAGAFGGIIQGNLQPEFWLPLMAGGWLNDVVPQVITIDCTLGIGTLPGGQLEAAVSPKYADLRLGIARMAALRIRESINELIPSGANIDGQGTNFSSAIGMFDRITPKIAEFKQRYIDTYTPVRVTVI